MAEEDQEDSRKNLSSSTETAGSANTNPTTHHDDGASEWLRLGIGCSAPHHNQNNTSNNKHSSDHPLELNLLPGGATSPFQQRPTPAAAGFLRPPPPPPLFYYQPQQQQQQLIRWVDSNSSSNGNYFRMMTPVIPNYGINPTQPAAPQLLLQPRPTTSFQSQPLADPLIRLVDPPRRPHCGIWFLLQPSLHQSKQPFLPHLTKNYLRIKDGRMTVRFLMKYLVNKLGLESETEVEIRCRGEQLEANLTMQHVRDEIWGSTHHVRELAASSAVHHLMILHYARSS